MKVNHYCLFFEMLWRCNRQKAVATIYCSSVFVLAFQFTARNSCADLVAFYTFEGNASDVSGNGNDGTVNGASLVDSGYEGHAYQFDGINDFIEIPININPGILPRVTIGAWANPDVVSGIRAIISHDNGDFDRNLNIDPRGPGDGDRYSAFTGSGVTSTGPDPALIGEWVFVSARYDDISNFLTLDVGTDRITVSANPGNGFDVIRIGANPNPAKIEFWPGRIDNVFIFDELLSDDRIDEIRNGGSAAILMLGDVNCDMSVDLLDVAPFVDLVVSGKYLNKADINLDGNVDLLDVQPFVKLLTSD